MENSMKVLSTEEICTETEAAGGSASCEYTKQMCNFNWSSLIAGGSIFDALLGSRLDCGTCTYWAEQCGWKYVWNGSGNAWTGGCGSTCICH